MYIFNITKWVQVDPMDPCKSPSRGQGSIQGTAQEGRLLTGLQQCGLASNCDCTQHTIALCFLASFCRQCETWRLEARQGQRLRSNTNFSKAFTKLTIPMIFFFFFLGFCLQCLWSRDWVVLAMTTVTTHGHRMVSVV